MITELIFEFLFLIPSSIVGLVFSSPVDIGAFTNFAGLLELLAIGNQFFPVGQILNYALIWFGLQLIALFKWGIDWLLSLIPMY